MHRDILFVNVSNFNINTTCTIFLDIVLEFEELVYNTTEGGLGMVMVCINLVSGILSRPVDVDVQPKPSDPLLDTATGM